MKNKRWSKEESGYLCDNFGILSYTQMTNHLDRTVSGIRLKAQRLGITQAYNIVSIGQRYERLTVSKKTRNQNGRVYWICLCDCGNTITTRSDNLSSKRARSCGCLQKEHTARMGASRKKDLSGQKFGRLTAIETKKKYRHSYLWVCICDCGNKTSVPIGHLMSGHTKSCGNCQNRVNGRMVSYPQVSIAEMFNAELNYKVGNRYIDIAFPERKIAIEYDGWYWHRNNSKQDYARVMQLIDLGWKVLAIKSRTKVPSKDQIDHNLWYLSPDQPYREMILPDWGKGVTSQFVTR